MYIKKQSCLTAVLLTLLIMFNTLPITAQTTATFHDVPTTHFAFEAINWVSNPDNGAFMVGDAGNNFNPNRTLTKFEAAQIFAMAAGFRHSTANLPAVERDMINRSFDTWNNFLNTMDEQYSRWSRIFNREIAFLLYRGILTVNDVDAFISQVGQVEEINLLTMEDAVVWMVRLIGRQNHAQAVSLPFHTPFRDEARINTTNLRSIYYASEAGIIEGGNRYFNPTHSITRANLAVLFFNALSESNGDSTVNLINNHAPEVLVGVIESMDRDVYVYISSADGVERFSFAEGVVITIDDVQRTPSFLQAGMQVRTLINANRQIITLVARSQEPQQTPPPHNLPAGQTFHADEGFVVSVSMGITPSITIRTQRVSITGQIINDERTFTVAPGARIIRGNSLIALDSITAGEIAFFQFSGTTIHDLTILERERTLEGTLLGNRPPDHTGMPALLVESNNGMTYELRITPATEFTRGHIYNLRWNDLRIGDSIVAELEYDRIIRVQATGYRTNVDGQVTQINISENNSQITLQATNGEISTFVLVPGTHDIYSLRIGMNLRLMLDSREIIDVELLDRAGSNQTGILGFIQSISHNAIVVVEGSGAQTRTHTITINSDTTVLRGGVVVTLGELRANMNVYISLVNANSNVARTITVLP